jgi:hypothetical protein
MKALTYTLDSLIKNQSDVLKILEMNIDTRRLFGNMILSVFYPDKNYECINMCENLGRYDFHELRIDYVDKDTGKTGRDTAECKMLPKILSNKIININFDITNIGCDIHRI